VIFTELELPGAFTVEVELIADERGAFARTFCTDEFGDVGLDPNVAQCSLSLNRRRGTLRGMHLQHAPHEETKLVRCTRGRIHDVIVDLRPDSPTLGRWAAVELAADLQNALYVPRGFAHGFLTLEDDTQVDYVISTPYAPAASVGVRWDDPTIGIEWPFEPSVMSERDRLLPAVDLDRIRRSGLQAALGAR
jgi:dTDP-4-dehydrorhamnose 3,5-epimerase